MSGTRVDEGINKSNVLSGAKVSFFLGDQTTPVAYATSVNGSINVDVVPIHAIDRLAVIEHAVVAYSVSFSVSRFRIPKVSGLPGTGSPVELGWLSKLQNMLTQGTIKARFFDKTSQQDVLVVDECVCTNLSFALAARDISTENLNFVGILAWDEAGVQNTI